MIRSKKFIVLIAIHSAAGVADTDRFVMKNCEPKMNQTTKKPERIGVTWHPHLAAAEEEAKKIIEEINTRFHGQAVAEGWSLYDEAFRESLERRPFDLVITFGGDGTMLRTNKLCAPFEVPVCGINMGSFGFMMEIAKNQWREKLPALMNGDWRIEKRMMLHVELVRKDNERTRWEVLNDAVIGHGSKLRPIRINVRINENYLTDYVADGLIVSTATGSTAYAMAAGGPIMEPELRNILVIPVAPHLCLERGIVLDENDVVEIRSSSEHETIFSPDGQDGMMIDESDTISVSASEFSARYVRLEGKGFFYSNFIQYMQRNPSANRKTTI
ncbi:MAG TPA: NAD(+)/NADH kinase [Flexilinea sp.]|nr:NAD(+)/NADH kinase [Flexilinea sp.]